MIQASGIVLTNKKIASSYFKIALALPQEFEAASPGQFVMVRIPGDGDTILRRPFSIHRLIMENGIFIGIEILYKVVGKGTSALAKILPRDQIDTLGPLGKGFVLPEQINNGFLVAGGIGIAPLICLVADMKKKGLDMGHLTLFLGAASRNDLLCIEEVQKSEIRLYITTDDGTCGEKGRVTGPLEKALLETPPDILFSCGPLVMLKHVAALAQRHKISCQISLESMMACGMGACLGCAVKNSYHPEKYDHVCVDGPVFDLNRFCF